MKEHPNPCNGCKHGGSWDCVSRTGTILKEECYVALTNNTKEDSSEDNTTVKNGS